MMPLITLHPRVSTQKVSSTQLVDHAVIRTNQEDATALHGKN
jgi:hypothetical protein